MPSKSQILSALEPARGIDLAGDGRAVYVSASFPPDLAAVRAAEYALEDAGMLYFREGENAETLRVPADPEETPDPAGAPASREEEASVLKLAELVSRFTPEETAEAERGTRWADGYGPEKLENASPAFLYGAGLAEVHEVFAARAEALDAETLALLGIRVPEPAPEVSPLTAALQKARRTPYGFVHVDCSAEERGTLLEEARLNRLSPVVDARTLGTGSVRGYRISIPAALADAFLLGAPEPPAEEDARNVAEERAGAAGAAEREDASEGSSPAGWGAGTAAAVSALRDAGAEVRVSPAPVEPEEAGTLTYAAAAEKLGRSARAVSRACRELGIPRPLTEGDVDRLGTYLYGPYSGSPRMVQLPSGHFRREADLSADALLAARGWAPIAGGAPEPGEEGFTEWLQGAPEEEAPEMLYVPDALLSALRRRGGTAADLAARAELTEFEAEVILDTLTDLAVLRAFPLAAVAASSADAPDADVVYVLRAAGGAPEGEPETAPVLLPAGETFGPEDRELKVARRDAERYLEEAADALQELTREAGRELEGVRTWLSGGSFSPLARSLGGPAGSNISRAAETFLFAVVRAADLADRTARREAARTPREEAPVTEARVRAAVEAGLMAPEETPEAPAADAEETAPLSEHALSHVLSDLSRADGPREEADAFSELEDAGYAPEAIRYALSRWTPPALPADAAGLPLEDGERVISVDYLPGGELHAITACQGCNGGPGTGDPHAETCAFAGHPDWIPAELTGVYVPAAEVSPGHAHPLEDGEVYVRWSGPYGIGLEAPEPVRADQLRVLSPVPGEQVPNGAGESGRQGVYRLVEANRD